MLVPSVDADEHGEPGRSRKNRCHRQDALTECTAVSDVTCVGLLVDLLGGRSRSNKCVKATDRTAGDRHEEQRKPAWRIGGKVSVNRRGDDFGVRNQNPEEDDAECHEELVAVDVVARLQQYPNRQHRSKEAVHEQNDHPPGTNAVGSGRVGRRLRVARCQLRHRRVEPEEVRQAERNVLSQPDEGVQREQCGNRRPEDSDAGAVDEKANDNRHYQTAPHG